MIHEGNKFTNLTASAKHIWTAKILQERGANECHFLSSPSMLIRRKKVKSLSRVWLFVTPWTLDYQAPPSMGFSRHEYWSGLPFPSPMHESEKWNHSVVSDSSQSHGLQSTRLLHPWDSPGTSTRVGCHCLKTTQIMFKIFWWNSPIFSN